MYEFKYALTREDYIDFNIYFYNTSKSMKRTVNISRIMILLISIGIPFIMSNPVVIPVLIMTSLMGIGIFIFYPKLINSRLEKRINKMLDEDSNGDMFSETTLFISDEGIKAISKNASTIYQWSGITRVGKSERYVYMFVNRVMAIILPNSVFQDVAAIEEFLQYCEGKNIK